MWRVPAPGSPARLMLTGVVVGAAGWELMILGVIVFWTWMTVGGYAPEGPVNAAPGYVYIPVVVGAAVGMLSMVVGVMFAAVGVTRWMQRRGKTAVARRGDGESTV